MCLCTTSKAAAALAAKKAHEKAAAADRAAERAAHAEKRRLKAAQAAGGGGKPARKGGDGNGSRPTSAAKSIAEGGSRGGARRSSGGQVKVGHRGEPSLKQRMARQKANNSWKTALLKYIDAELCRLPVFAVNGQPNLATGKAPPAVPKRYQTKLLRQWLAGENGNTRMTFP